MSFLVLCCHSHRSLSKMYTNYSIYLSARHTIGMELLFCLSALAEISTAIFTFQEMAAKMMTESSKVELGWVVARVAPNCIAAIAAIRIQSFEGFFVQQGMSVSGFAPAVWHDEFHWEDALIHVLPIIMDSGVVYFMFDQSAKESAFLVVIIGVGSPAVE